LTAARKAGPTMSIPGQLKRGFSGDGCESYAVELRLSSSVASPSGLAAGPCQTHEQEAEGGDR